jgi:hypothetical protein
MSRLRATCPLHLNETQGGPAPVATLAVSLGPTSTLTQLTIPCDEALLVAVNEGLMNQDSVTRPAA